MQEVPETALPVATLPAPIFPGPSVTSVRGQAAYSAAAFSLSGSNSWICTDGMTVEIACL